MVTVDNSMVGLHDKQVELLLFVLEQSIRETKNTTVAMKKHMETCLNSMTLHELMEEVKARYDMVVKSCTICDAPILLPSGFTPHDFIRCSMHPSTTMIDSLKIMIDEHRVRGREDD